ncbi:hypothetical protein ACFYU5_08190 [Nocardia aobensis]|uniref:Uncharacterized protein n=1 Tax=Nocardia aobensis TaxID=257277 RepID=A0ABW6P1V9_9NOCA
MSITGTALGITGHEELSLAARGAAASLWMLNTMLEYRTRR